MISSDSEYQKAREELEQLTAWLARLEKKEVAKRKGLTAASVRRMIARVHDEIAQYEAGLLSAPPQSEKGTKPDGAGAEGRDEGPN